MSEEAAKTAYTKQSFSKAHQKLLSDVFTLLNDDLIWAYYDDNNFKTYLGFRLLAVNGSVMELSKTKETQKEYGYLGERM